jgi:putative redox protein
MPTSRVTYLSDLRTEAQHIASGQKIVTDAPVDNHGKGEAFSPTDIFATAFASCMLTIMGIAARTHHIDIDGAEAEVTKIMGTEPRRVARIEVKIYMPPNSYTAKEQKILEVAAKTCPVAMSLHPDIEQVIEWVWVE